MPIPKPNKDESEKEFTERCMADEVMTKEYPDQKQRYAICSTQWKDKDKKSLEIPEIEKRTVPATELRLNKSEDGKKKTITGYAAVFNKLSDDLGGFREQIAPGAFSKTIKTDDIRALFNHDPNKILGRTKAGTLRLKEDDKGLAFECDVPDTQAGSDLVTSMSRGDIDQCSFSFRTNSDTWDNTDKANITRTLNDVTCMDVSPVTFPAYPQTSCKVRDYLSALKDSAKEKPDNQCALPKEGRVGSLELAKRQLDLE